MQTFDVDGLLKNLTTLGSGKVFSNLRQAMYRYEASEPLSTLSSDASRRVRNYKDQRSTDKQEDLHKIDLASRVVMFLRGIEEIFLPQIFKDEEQRQTHIDFLREKAENFFNQHWKNKNFSHPKDILEFRSAFNDFATEICKRFSQSLG